MKDLLYSCLLSVHLPSRSRTLNWHLETIYMWVVQVKFKSYVRPALDSSSIEIEVYKSGKTRRILKVAFHLQMCTEGVSYTHFNRHVILWISLMFVEPLAYTTILIFPKGVQAETTAATLHAVACTGVHVISLWLWSFPQAWQLVLLLEHWQWWSSLLLWSTGRHQDRELKDETQMYTLLPFQQTHICHVILFLVSVTN